MADASAARTKAVFEFKSATLPLIAVILKTADLSLLATALDLQLADSPDFFEQEPVVIDLSQLPEDDASAAIDFRKLRDMLARHQTQPIAVRGGSAAHNAAARAAGLSIAEMPAAGTCTSRTICGASGAGEGAARGVGVGATGISATDRPAARAAACCASLPPRTAIGCVW